MVESDKASADRQGRDVLEPLVGSPEVAVVRLGDLPLEERVRLMRRRRGRTPRLREWLGILGVAGLAVAMTIFAVLTFAH